MLVKIKNLIKVVSNLLFAKNKTYCHLLWDSLFIDSYGDIYVCCHFKPGKIGNIYHGSLSKILSNSIKMKYYKLLSLNKCLVCCYNCNIIPEEKKSNRSSLQTNLKYPKKIWILYGELCNISCTMCGQDHRSKVMLDDEIIKKNIDWAQIEEIEFQGGEILAMKKAKDLFLWLTGSLHKKVNLITNGLLINDEWAEHLVKGSNWIAISVNAATEETHEAINKGSNFTKVISNIKRLVDLKCRNQSTVQIIFKYTIIPENLDEIASSLELAASLGCDKIAFGYDYSVLEFLHKNEGLRTRLREEVTQTLGTDLKLSVDTCRLEYLGLL